MNIQNLKTARKAAGYTQAETAKAISSGLGTYKNYEQGTREPKGDTIVKLADLFNVTTDYLLGRNPDEPNIVDVLAREFGLSDSETKLLLNYINLPQNIRRKVFDFLRESI